MATVIEFKLTGVDGALDLLKSLPPEVVSKRGGPVKSSLRKAALVILREWKLNLAHATQNLTTDEQHNTGLLADNLIASRGKPPEGQNGERYLLRVRKRFYTRKGRKVSTLISFRLLEYGSEKQPAEPTLRPAGATKAAEAIATMQTELVNGIDRVVRKMKRGK